MAKVSYKGFGMKEQDLRTKKILKAKKRAKMALRKEKNLASATISVYSDGYGHIYPSLVLKYKDGYGTYLNL